MQWMSTIVCARITCNWETIITSLYQIIIYNIFLVDILIEIIVLCAEILYHYTNLHQVHYIFKDNLCKVHYLNVQ